jgi:hypothetical protein
VVVAPCGVRTFDHVDSVHLSCCGVHVPGVHMEFGGTLGVVAVEPAPARA